VPKLVCIVDDDDLVRRAIALSLQAFGFDTVELDNGCEVAAMLAAKPVDVLVLDMIMPDKDGIEVINEIRQRWPNLRIVAMSGGGRLGDNLYLTLARHIGADACLTKPFLNDDLRAAIG
jgi:CheY-like chemotaxis protein